MPIETELKLHKEIFMLKEHLMNFIFYIEKAREDIITKFGTGVLFDIHGHGINPDGFNDLRTWIGYLLT